MKKYAIGMLLAVSLCAGGCRGMSGPQWFHPGSREYQQGRAVLHDPYTDNTAGPEVVGVRPRDFQEPATDQQKARWMRNVWP